MIRLNMLLLVVTLILLTLTITLVIPPVDGQTDEDPLPVLLIHGYYEGPEVWEAWLNELQDDGITAEAVEFEFDDQCGTSASHAQELVDIVNRFKDDTQADKINIVAHSKGGLDARLYLANDLTNTDIANLIMIGTPNHGSPLVWGVSLINPFTVPPLMLPIVERFFCLPAASDLRPGSDATLSVKNTNTKYYTIAGSWRPDFYFSNVFSFSFASNCHQASWLPLQRWGSDFIILGQDDGLVPLRSAVPSGFKNLGISDDCHTNLLSEQQEYDWAKQILLPE
jgi:pimeloyl-ACP methyl ester carboxylesterase